MISIKKIDLHKLPVSKILIIGLLTICYFSIKQCRLNELSLSSKGLDIKMYQNNQQAFEAKKNALGQELATQKLNVIERDKEIEKQLLKNSELKSLVTQVRTESKTSINNMLAKYEQDAFIEVSAMVVEHPGSDDYIAADTTKIEAIKVGTKFSLVDTGNWYMLRGSVQRSGILIDSLGIRNELTVNIGNKRVKGIKGLFGKTEPTVEMINNNPYTSTMSMNNIHIKETPKKWWQTKAAFFTAGIIGGLMVPVLVPVLIK